MIWSLFAMLIGFGLDLVLGDPRAIPHPIVGIGRLISFLEKRMRKAFSPTKKGERMAGAYIWILCVGISTAIPALLLWGCQAISPWLRLVAESVMCWQILALKSLRSESMKVYHALRNQGLKQACDAVSMIVGRDTERLDAQGVIKAAVETVAENASDGVIAPLLCIAIGGAPLGFLYKAVNTMDSMLGYIDPPYTNVGWFPAKADDVMNFLPSRLCAMLMLAGGWVCNRFRGGRRYDVSNGWRIFCRDRRNHASPNSAQTEAVCAGLLRIQLAGDAWYHGYLHKKPFIGDALRSVREDDIPGVCRLLYATAFLGLALCTVGKALGILLLLCRIAGTIPNL